MLGNFACFLWSADYFKINFFKKILECQAFWPDQAGKIVGSDLCPKCLQRLSADNTAKQKLRILNTFCIKTFPDFLRPEFFHKCVTCHNMSDT